MELIEERGRRIAWRRKYDRNMMEDKEKGVWRKLSTAVSATENRKDKSQTDIKFEELKMCVGWQATIWQASKYLTFKRETSEVDRQKEKGRGWFGGIRMSR